MSGARPIGRRLVHHAFSTTEFVPGHVVGAAILLFGTIAVARALVSSGRSASRELAARSSVENDRGQYGSPP